MNIKELHFDKRFVALIQERDKKIDLWREISEFIAPNMGLFDEDEPNSPIRRGDEIIDSSVRRALSTLQAGMQGGLTSPSKAWFQLTVKDPALAILPPVMMWCNDVRDVLINIFSQSNTYNRLHGAYGEIGAFGTAALLVEDDEERIINTRLMTAGEYAVSFDVRGMPNAFCRKLWMSALDMQQAYGKENLSNKVKNALENNREGEWFRVWHLIGEDGTQLSSGKKLTRFPYFSLYWEPSEEKELSLGGYEEFPVLVPRWDTIGSDYYGYGPGEMALPESKTLQLMRTHFLKADELMIDPPVAFPQNVLGEHVQIQPGGVYYVSDPNHVAKPLYQVTPDYPGHLQAMMDSRKLIDQLFYADLFLMMASMEDRNDMTATEVTIRQQEKMQMLGPVVERLEYELLNPLVGRTYMIAQRRGLIPEPPEELQGADVKIEYISMLALAQKASSMDGVNQLLGLVTGLAGIDPQIIDKVNADQILDEFVKLSAVPPSIIRGRDEVEAMRAQKQQQQQQAQEMQQGQQVAQMAQAGGAGMRDIAQATQDMGGLGGLLGGAATEPGL